MAGSSPSQRRRKSRDLLVRALYQWQINESTEAELIDQLAEDGELGDVDEIHFRRVLAAVLGGAEAFDRVIAAHASRSIDQLDEIGRSVLLMAIAELAHCADVPTKVVINEAVELAKRYGAADSFRFVNAVLDRAAKELR